MANKDCFAKTAIDFYARIAYNKVTVMAIETKNADSAMKEGAGSEVGKGN